MEICKGKLCAHQSSLRGDCASTRTRHRAMVPGREINREKVRNTAGSFPTLLPQKQDGVTYRFSHLKNLLSPGTDFCDKPDSVRNSDRQAEKELALDCDCPTDPRRATLSSHQHCAKQVVESQEA